MGGGVSALGGKVGGDLDADVGVQLGTDGRSAAYRVGVEGNTVFTREKQSYALRLRGDFAIMAHTANGSPYGGMAFYAAAGPYWHGLKEPPRGVSLRGGFDIIDQHTGSLPFEIEIEGGADQDMRANDLSPAGALRLKAYF